MENRFGFKDFVVIIMLLGVGVMLVLGMIQSDRQWEQAQQVKQKVVDIERQLARVQEQIEARGSVAAPPAPELSRSLDELSRQLTALRTRLDPATGLAGLATPAPPAVSPQPNPGASKPVVAPRPSASARDESWARPGVPIAWQPPWSWASDPAAQKGYQTGRSFTEVFEVRLAKITPHIQTDVYGRRVVDLVAESLGAYDPKTLELRGLLAEAWQMDPAGLWLRVKIRDQARFSDGTPVSAEDMRWTWHDYIMNPQIEAQRLRSIYADIIAKVEVVSERVVEFTFRNAFFSNLDSALTIHVLPRRFYEQFQPAEINKATGLLMGSGPYKLETLDSSNQWTPGKPISLVRNEQYWGLRSPLDSMRFLDITDELSRLTYYKNNDADMITPSAPQYRTLDDQPDWRAANQDLNWVNMRSGKSFIAWNCGERKGKLTPFADKRVRLAMTLLIDRERMIRDIWSGVGEVCKGYASPGTPSFDPDLRPWPKDAARALALLKEAGWEDRDGDGLLDDKDGRRFEFEYTLFGGNEISKQIALFVKDSCENAGIKVTLREMDWSVGDNMRKTRDFDAFSMAWGANAPESDPKQIFHSESIKDQGDNFAQWSSPEADRLIEAGRRELDPAKRALIWRQFDRVMHDEQPYTWVRVQPYLRFVKPDIRNVNPHPKGLEPWEYFRGGPATPASGG